MSSAHRWMLAAALAQAIRASATRPNAAPSESKPEEEPMNDVPPPADAPAQPAPNAAPAPEQPAQQPAQPAPGAAAGGGVGGGAHDVPAITDYLPVMLAATSGLLKAASAIQKQVDANQEVPAFYLDMAGNFLGMLGIMAEAYRRNTRRDREQGDDGGDAAPGSAV